MGNLRVLHPGDLAELPLACPTCTLGDDLQPEAAWAFEAERSWGLCGVALLQQGDYVGFALVSPALYVPRTHPGAKGPLAPDSAVLMALRVVEEARGAGSGRQLVQHLAARLYGKRDLAAIEAVGSRGAGTCVAPPAEWLLAAGFVPLDNRPLQPRFRLELATTVPWLDVRAAWRRVVSWVPLPPVAPPEPAGMGTPRVAASSEG